MKNIKLVFTSLFLMSSSFIFSMEQEEAKINIEEIKSKLEKNELEIKRLRLEIIKSDFSYKLIKACNNRYFEDVKKVIKDIENYSEFSGLENFLKEIINFQDSDGETVLFMTIRSISNLGMHSYVGWKKIIKLLLKKSADPNIRPIKTTSILFYVTNQCEDDIIELLVKFGADLEIKDSVGFTSLMTNLLVGRSEKRIDLLISLGADIDARDNNGYTILILLANSLTKERIKFLLDHGADFYIKNNEGQTALDRALEYGQNKDIIKLLEDAQKENKSLIRKLIRRINRGSENSKNKIKLLLAAHPKLVNCEGNNALHIAAQLRNKKMFKFILGGCPALLKKINHAGLTPIEESPEMLVFLILDLK